MEEERHLERPPPSGLRSGRSEVVQRLLAQKCELCGAEEDLSRSTMSANWLIWTGRDGANDLYGSSGWPHAAARPGRLPKCHQDIHRERPGGARGQGTGEPDEIERLMPGLGEGPEKCRR